MLWEFVLHKKDGIHNVGLLNQHLKTSAKTLTFGGWPSVSSQIYYKVSDGKQTQGFGVTITKRWSHSRRKGSLQTWLRYTISLRGPGNSCEKLVDTRSIKPKSYHSKRQCYQKLSGDVVKPVRNNVKCYKFPLLWHLANRKLKIPNDFKQDTFTHAIIWFPLCSFDGVFSYQSVWSCGVWAGWLRWIFCHMHDIQIFRVSTIRKKWQWVYVKAMQMLFFFFFFFF